MESRDRRASGELRALPARAFELRRYKDSYACTMQILWIKLCCVFAISNEVSRGSDHIEI